MKQKENTVILSKWINLGMSKIYIKDQMHISLPGAVLSSHGRIKKVTGSCETEKMNKLMGEQEIQMNDDALINA